MSPYPLDRRIVWVPLWQGWFIRYPGYWDGAFASYAEAYALLHRLRHRPYPPPQEKEKET